MTTAIHFCPGCGLRFHHVGELVDHLRMDHRPKEDAPRRRPWGQVTVAIDPSVDNRTTVDVATALARQTDMGVALVSAPSDGLDASVVEAVLRKEARAVTDGGAPDCSWHLLPAGDIPRAVLDVADSGDTTMLCMSSHARGPLAEMALGSISEDVLRHSRVPVLLIGPHVKPSPDPYSHLLVAVDGSDVADMAVDVAAGLAPRMGADLVLVSVVDPDLELPPDVEESIVVNRTAMRLPASWTSTDVIHDKRPSRGIMSAAAQMPNALVVMGTHGRSGVQRLAVGSVALEVVRGATAPVLVVPFRPPVGPRRLTRSD